MADVIKKAFQISNGLASLAHKKAKEIISDLQKEKALTPQESKKAVEALTKAKTKIYDNMSKELQKVLAQVEKEVAKRKAQVKKVVKK